MKKKILIFIAMIIVLSGCGIKEKQNNAEHINPYSIEYDYAYIKLPDNTYILGKVKRYTRATNNDNIYILFEDGSQYLTNSVNCVLVKEPSRQ